MFNFKYTYKKLPKTFYEKIEPYMFDDPKILLLNDQLAKDLNIDLKWLESEGHLFLSSNRINQNFSIFIIIFHEIFIRIDVMFEV